MGTNKKHLIKVLEMSTHTLCFIGELTKLILMLSPNTHPNWGHIMRKPAFNICKNKGADQLRGNREADHRLCFRIIDSIIPLLSISEISSL